MIIISCKKEDNSITYKQQQSQSDTLNADFQVKYNIDSPNKVYFINKSKGFEKCTWYFSDSSLSNELSPIHIFNNGNIHVVKLVVSNSNNQIDSISVEFDVRNLNISNSVFCISINPTVYKFYMHFPGKDLYTICYDNQHPNELYSINDSTVFQYQDKQVKTFTIYRTEDNVTSYYTRNTLDLLEIENTLSTMSGIYNFDNRYYFSQNQADVLINDTLLNVKCINGKISIEDTKLGHEFSGVLTLNSTKDKLHFYNLSNFRNLNQYEVVRYNEYVDYENKSINATSTQTVGTKVTQTSGVRYYGVKL